MEEGDAQRFAELSRLIQEQEAKGNTKSLTMKKEQLKDLAQTVTTLEQGYAKACQKTEKEKSDVDKMQHPSTRDFFKDQQSFDQKMSVEMEEYLEAVTEQENLKKQLDGVVQQRDALTREVEELSKQRDQLLQLYDEQDAILDKIFNGEYGSELENRLEAECEALREKKDRISLARIKWTNARVLLTHAVQQMGVCCQRWQAITSIPPNNPQARYFTATEARNNIIAAIQNITSAQRYLNNIKFPYCEPSEIATLNRACQNVYIDMATLERHRHAFNCFHVTYRRAAALLQWFDSVINTTINRDFEAAKQELSPKERALKEERLRLIKEKLGSSADNLQLSISQDEYDDELEPELVAIEAEKTEGGDNDLSVVDGPPAAPTPMPMNQLAPPPSQEDLFGNIEQLKQQHQKEMEEFDKAQQTNRARMEQGLQEKLATRRNNRRKRAANL